jgi:hypothetical protein
MIKARNFFMPKDKRIRTYEEVKAEKEALEKQN